jgi:hypothetical protein
LVATLWSPLKIPIESDNFFPGLDRTDCASARPGGEGFPVALADGLPDKAEGDGEAVDDLLMDHDVFVESRHNPGV